MKDITHNFKKSFGLTIILAILSTSLFSQPSSTPATGFEWVNVGAGVYNTNQESTTPGVPSDTSFGAAGDSDPASCASFCGGACDGEAYIQAIVFGTTPGFTNSSCEQRAVTLTEWNNANPDSGVSSGASSGTVYIPQSANLIIVQSPSDGDPGTGVGGDENRSWIIGGNGPGNTSEFKVDVNYEINWDIPNFSISGGSGTQNYNFTWNWGEPGGGIEQETSGWNNYTTDGFGQSFGQTYAVPLGSISQTGAALEINFIASSSIDIIRNFGNADGKAQHGPGMEGRAQYIVNYDIWEIQASLPVKLVTFTGKEVRDQEIDLVWETESEVNSSFFEVQTSTDGSLWKSVDEVESKGYQYGRMEYKYLHKTKNANPYYRLKQVDLDGSFEYSDVIRVVTNNKLSNTLVYPNPFENIVNIDIKQLKECQIIDIKGRIVHEGISATVDLSEFSSGIYYLKTVGIDNQISLSKLVKL